MNKIIVIGFLLIFCMCNTGIALGQLSKENNSNLIRHTVVFKLIHPKDSPEEKVFLDAIRKLSTIPGVQKFELMKQTSKKNNYDYGLSMEFKSAKEYEGYNQHPEHISFVQTFWVKEVSDFLEIDYEPFE
jgi:hypothetical protein